MSARPYIEPEVLAELVAQAPQRVLKKIESDASLYASIALVQEGSALVASVGSERVTLEPLDARLTRVEQLRCSCLLAPRCAHLLGIARSLPIAAQVAPTSSAAEVVEEPSSGEGAIEAVTLDAPQREAAVRAFAAAASVIEHGASALGALREAELLRAIHAARVASLPRLASALVRVVRGVRALAAHAPELELEVLAADLAEALHVAHVLSSRPTRSAIGRHRREMEPLGGLRLTGLFSEPVIASTGHVGVVTTLVSDDGRFFTLADVRPGEPSRAHTSYATGVRIGEATLSHAELCRSGLFVQEAMASPDGRLGQGQDVRAVRRAAQAWHEAPTVALFDVPAAAQLTRALRAAERADDDRPAGWDLVFTRAVLRARTHDALVVQAADGTVLFTELASDHPALHDRETLRTLGGHEGLPLALALRVHVARSIRVTLVALFVDPADEARRIALPPSLQDRLMPGLDSLEAAAIAAGDRCPRVSPSTPHDPLAPLSRRLVRMVSGGRSSVGAGSRGSAEREARGLERVGLATAANASRALTDEALTRARDLRGARDRGDSVALARAFLAASEVERTIRLALLTPDLITTT